MCNVLKCMPHFANLVRNQNPATFWPKLDLVWICKNGRFLAIAGAKIQYSAKSMQYTFCRCLWKTTSCASLSDGNCCASTLGKFFTPVCITRTDQNIKIVNKQMHIVESEVS